MNAWGWILMHHCFSLILLVGFLIPAIWWDLLLFKFRTLAGAASFDTVAKAQQLLRGSDIAPAGETMIAQLANIGAYGYLAATGIAVLTLEMALKKMNEYFSRFMQPADDLLASWSNPQGEHTTGNDIEQPAKPDQADAHPSGQGSGGDGGEPLFDSPNSDPAAAPKASHQPETPRTRPVMGGAPGAVVELQEALRHPERFHVDTAGTVWTRSFWNELRA